MERDVGERTAEELPVLTEALPILAEELRISPILAGGVGVSRCIHTSRPTRELLLLLLGLLGRAEPPAAAIRRIIGHAHQRRIIKGAPKYHACSPRRESR